MLSIMISFKVINVAFAAFKSTINTHGRQLIRGYVGLNPIPSVGIMVDKKEEIYCDPQKKEAFDDFQKYVRHKLDSNGIKTVADLEHHKSYRESIARFDSMNLPFVIILRGNLMNTGVTYLRSKCTSLEVMFTCIP